MPSPRSLPLLADSTTPPTSGGALILPITTPFEISQHESVDPSFPSATELPLLSNSVEPIIPTKLDPLPLLPSASPPPAEMTPPSPPFDPLPQTSPSLVLPHDSNSSMELHLISHLRSPPPPLPIPPPLPLPLAPLGLVHDLDSPRTHRQEKEEAEMVRLRRLESDRDIEQEQGPVNVHTTSSVVPPAHHHHSHPHSHHRDMGTSHSVVSIDSLTPSEWQFLQHHPLQFTSDQQHHQQPHPSIHNPLYRVRHSGGGSTGGGNSSVASTQPSLTYNTPIHLTSPSHQYPHTNGSGLSGERQGHGGIGGVGPSSRTLVSSSIHDEETLSLATGHELAQVCTQTSATLQRRLEMVQQAQMQHQAKLQQNGAGPSLSINIQSRPSTLSSQPISNASPAGTTRPVSQLHSSSSMPPNLPNVTYSSSNMFSTILLHLPNRMWKSRCLDYDRLRTHVHKVIHLEQQVQKRLAAAAATGNVTAPNTSNTPTTPSTPGAVAAPSTSVSSSSQVTAEGLASAQNMFWCIVASEWDKVSDFVVQQEQIVSKSLQEWIEMWTLYQRQKDSSSTAQPSSDGSIKQEASSMTDVPSSDSGDSSGTPPMTGTISGLSLSTDSGTRRLDDPSASDEDPSNALLDIISHQPDSERSPTHPRKRMKRSTGSTPNEVATGTESGAVASVGHSNGVSSVGVDSTDPSLLAPPSAPIVLARTFTHLLKQLIQQSKSTSGVEEFAVPPTTAATTTTTSNSLQPPPSSAVSVSPPSATSPLPASSEHTEMDLTLCRKFISIATLSDYLRQFVFLNYTSLWRLLRKYAVHTHKNHSIQSIWNDFLVGGSSNAIFPGKIFSELWHRLGSVSEQIFLRPLAQQLDGALPTTSTGQKRGTLAEVPLVALAHHAESDFQAHQYQSKFELPPNTSAVYDACAMCKDEIACPARLPCGHRFCFACWMASPSCGAICPCCRSELKGQDDSEVFMGWMQGLSLLHLQKQQRLRLQEVERGEMMMLQNQLERSRKEQQHRQQMRRNDAMASSTKTPPPLSLASKLTIQVPPPANEMNGVLHQPQAANVAMPQTSSHPHERRDSFGNINQSQQQPLGSSSYHGTHSPSHHVSMLMMTRQERQLERDRKRLSLGGDSGGAPISRKRALGAMRSSSMSPRLPSRLRAIQRTHSARAPYRSSTPDCVPSDVSLPGREARSSELHTPSRAHEDSPSCLSVHSDSSGEEVGSPFMDGSMQLPPPAIASIPSALPPVSSQMSTEPPMSDVMLPVFNNSLSSTMIPQHLPPSQPQSHLLPLPLPSSSTSTMYHTPIPMVPLVSPDPNVLLPHTHPVPMNPLIPGVSSSSGGAMPSTGKRGQGASCHICKTTKPIPDLFLCTSRTHTSLGSKKCRKKYCQSCVRRLFSPDWLVKDHSIFYASTEGGYGWKCPSCANVCVCAGCERKANGNVEVPPKKRKITPGEKEKEKERVKSERADAKTATGTDAHSSTTGGTAPTSTSQKKAKANASSAPAPTRTIHSNARPTRHSSETKGLRQTGGADEHVDEEMDVTPSDVQLPSSTRSSSRSRRQPKEKRTASAAQQQQQHPSQSQQPAMPLSQSVLMPPQSHPYAVPPHPSNTTANGSSSTLNALIAQLQSQAHDIHSASYLHARAQLEQYLKFTAPPTSSSSHSLMYDLLHHLPSSQSTHPSSSSSLSAPYMPMDVVPNSLTHSIPSSSSMVPNGIGPPFMSPYPMFDDSKYPSMPPLSSPPMYPYQSSPRDSYSHLHSTGGGMVSNHSIGSTMAINPSTNSLMDHSHSHSMMSTNFANRSNSNLNGSMMDPNSIGNIPTSANQHFY